MKIIFNGVEIEVGPGSEVIVHEDYVTIRQIHEPVNLNVPIRIDLSAAQTAEVFKGRCRPSADGKRRLAC